MQKGKQSSSDKSSGSAEARQDASIQALCDLAIDLVEQEDTGAKPESHQEGAGAIQKLIKKCLYKKKDAVLYEALERTKYADSDAWRFLKSSIEEASAAIVVRRDGSEIEVNAFVIPLFVHSIGGLKREQCFQDQDAFELLVKSLKEAQLESPNAKLVLVSHAYHLDEIDDITYSHLNEMVLDATTSMTDKKIAATPAIERSLIGWPDNLFEPADHVVELRFLLGFALKAKNDPFYHVPEEETAADAYFAIRAERFRLWTADVLPVLLRCLSIDRNSIDINFLYQDLFHEGKESGIAEYAMLQMMSELNHDLDEHGVMAQDTAAVIGPADVGDEMVLRVNLYSVADGALLASSDKPLSITRDLPFEASDTRDALITIGVKSFSLAMKFDAEGQPVDVRQYEG